MELVDEMLSSVSAKDCTIETETIYLSDSTFDYTRNNMQEKAQEVSERKTSEELPAEDSSGNDTEVKTDKAEAETAPDNVSEDSSLEEDSTEDSSEEEKAEELKQDTGSEELKSEEITEPNLSIEKLDSLINRLGSVLETFASSQEEKIASSNNEQKLEVEEVESKENADSEEEAKTGTLSDEGKEEEQNIALKRIEELEASLSSAISTLALQMKRDSEVEGKDLNSLCEWFSAFSVEDNSKLEMVDNPSAASSDNADFSSQPKKSELGKFEQSIVNKYTEVAETNGNDAAENWFFSQRGYLPRGFHPNNFKS